MGVDRGYPRGSQELLSRVVEPQVGGVCVAAEVATLDQHPCGAHLPERGGLGADGVEVLGGVGVEQDGGLGEVWGDEGDVRQELAHRFDGVRSQQPGTGGGDHDGVEDHDRHRVGALVEEGGDDVDTGDSLGGLGGQRGEHCGAVGTECGEGLQGALDAGPAGGVRAGDRQRDRRVGAHG